jgi:hypothetical protein
MVNTFEFIGKLVIGKESEKFKPYEVITSAKGWVTKRLLFNVIAGDNRHMLESKGGYFKDESGKIFTFSKAGKDDNGNQIKGEKLEVAWKDRFKPEIIENVAEFKKFVVDLEEYGRRFKLEKAVEKKNDGTLIDEELLELGVDDVEKSLEDSKKKRKEFIAEADFTEYLHKVVSSGKINDKLFRVLGNIVDSEYNGKFYRKLVPTRVYLAEKDAKPSSIGQITVFFNKDSLDSNSLKDKKKYYVNGFVRDYDNNRKVEVPCPIQLVIDTTKDEENETNKKLNSMFVKQFTVKDKTWKEIGVKVKMLDGAQKTDITEDMLNDFQKELLELGAITMDDIRKELGKDIYGEKIQEYVIINAARGYTKGRKDTVFIDKDFVVEPVEILEKEHSENTESDEEDIFGDVDID